LKRIHIEQEKGEMMDKYRCTICNYLYEPEAGDPPNGVSPGTPFADVPDSWVCPVCGAEKNFFEKE
jgi:rubredoxin